MEHDSTLYVGLDVHKDSITVAYALGSGDVELPGKVGTTKTDIDRLCKRLQSAFAGNWSRKGSTAWFAHRH
jgi:transposase